MNSIHDGEAITFDSPFKPETLPLGGEWGNCQESGGELFRLLGDDPGDRRAFRVWTCPCRRCCRMSATFSAEAKDSPTLRRYWIASSAFFSANSRAM